MGINAVLYKCQSKSKIKLTKQGITVLFIAVLFYGCKSNESVLLRLNYAKDEEQSFTIAVKCNCSPEMHLMESLKTTFTADSVSNDHQYHLSSRINFIKTDINLGGFFGNGISEKFDSEKNRGIMDYKEQELAVKYDSIMDRYYQLTYNDRGEVVVPFNLNGKVVGAPFGPGMIQVSYPNKKVKVGDSWMVNMVGPLVSSAARIINGGFVFNYTVNDITDDKVILDVDIQKESQSELGSSTTAALKLSGVYTINRKNGRIETGYIKLPQVNCENALISITTN
jgi:hypothetical protein